MYFRWQECIPVVSSEGKSISIFISNIIFPSLGTFLMACEDKQNTRTHLTVAILQLLTIPLFFFGVFWSIWWGYVCYIRTFLYRNSEAYKDKSFHSPLPNNEKREPNENLNNVRLHTDENPSTEKKHTQEIKLDKQKTIETPPFSNELPKEKSEEAKVESDNMNKKEENELKEDTGENRM